MSRTIRKRIHKHEEWIYVGRSYRRYVINYYDLSQTKKVDKDIARAIYKHYTTSDKWYTDSLPKEFRNSVNRKRRAKDKSELWNELNIDDYEEQCSKWNCKDNRNWDYW